jgi:hypothetical protein
MHMSEPEIDFLTDEAPAEVVEEVVETPPIAETVETPEPPAPVVPTTPEPKEEQVPLAALKAERAKRQEYEARLRQYEQQANDPPPSFYEAPEQYVQKLLQQHDQHVTQRMLGALEAQAREVYPDYDEVFQIVQESAENNPVLTQQIMQAPNPAMAAYRLGKQLREMKAMQNPDEYRAKIEAEVRAKVDAEYRAKEEAKAKAAQAIPPDLTAARASRGDEVLPDDSLDSILKSKR